MASEILQILEGENPVSVETLLDLETLPGLEIFPGERKVRRIFILPSGEIITIATDRIGAFDQPHLTEDGRPAFYSGKGIITTDFVMLGKKWSGAYMPTDNCPRGIYSKHIPKELYSRSSVSLRAERIIPVEFIARSTAEGSLAEKAEANEKCCGQTLPDGIRLGQSLGRPYFTPSTKAPKGEKDKNLTIDEYYQIINNDDLANYLYGMSLLLHLYNRRYAKRCGLDRPDQKFEFGIFQPGLPVPRSIFLEEIFDEDATGNLFSDLCLAGGLPKMSWKNLPNFDLKKFLIFAKINAINGVIRLVDETWGTDDGRYRLLMDTEMGLKYYSSGEPRFAELFIKNYLCKEYFRLESKKTGRGGYDKEAGQTVTIPAPVLEETGRRNLMALLRLLQ